MSPAAARCVRTNLDKQPRRLQRNRLINRHNVARRRPEHARRRRCKFHRHHNRDDDRHQKYSNFATIRFRLARNRFVARHLHMHMAITLNAHRRENRARRVSRLLVTICQRRVMACGAFAQFTASCVVLLMRVAVRKRNAQHASRRRRNHALHHKQQHGDKFDDSGRHQVVESRPYPAQATSQTPPATLGILP